MHKLSIRLFVWTISLTISLVTLFVTLNPGGQYVNQISEFIVVWRWFHVGLLVVLIFTSVITLGELTQVKDGKVAPEDYIKKRAKALACPENPWICSFINRLCGYFALAVTAIFLILHGNAVLATIYIFLSVTFSLLNSYTTKERVLFKTKYMSGTAG